MKHHARPRSTAYVFALFAGVALLAAACGSDGGGGGSRIIVDSLDREIELPDEVNRVVSLNSDLSEVIYALGAGDKLVSAGYRISANEAWIRDQVPELGELPSPHTPAGINLEELAALEPDLVITTLFGEVGYEEVLDSVGRLDVPIVVVSLETLEAYGEDLMLIARALGVEDRGEALAAFLNEHLESVESRTSEIADDERVEAYHGLWDVYFTIGPGIFEHDQIEAAGGVNVASSLSGFGAEVSPEQLLAWNPDIIFMLWEGQSADVLADPKLTDLAAVRTGNVFSHPEQGWGFATPRAIFAVTWLAEKMYPESFEDIDIGEAADQFYEEVYGFGYPGPPLGGS